MRRIVRHSLFTALAAALVYGFDWIYASSLRDPQFFNGWVLFAGMTVLVLYNLRKKVPMLNIGRAATWMQLHLYTGYFVALVFALHTNWTLPENLFEAILWFLFVVVAVSGMVGIYLTKMIPPTLELHSERILFQRIPAYRAQLAREAEELAIASVNDSASLTISDLYTHNLHDFFRQPQNFLAHLRNSTRPLNRKLEEIAKLERYLDDKGKETLDKIRDLVRAKDNLDFHHYNQGVMKYWLFVHVPATYGLIVLALVHIAVMYAYSTGVP